MCSNEAKYAVAVILASICARGAWRLIVVCGPIKKWRAMMLSTSILFHWEGGLRYAMHSDGQ